MTNLQHWTAFNIVLRFQKSKNTIHSNSYFMNQYDLYVPVSMIAGPQHQSDSHKALLIRFFGDTIRQDCIPSKSKVYKNHFLKISCLNLGFQVGLVVLKKREFLTFKCVRFKETKTYSP